jgi:hypothetical protein
VPSALGWSCYGRPRDVLMTLSKNTRLTVRTAKTPTVRVVATPAICDERAGKAPPGRRLRRPRCDLEPGSITTVSTLGRFAWPLCDRSRSACHRRCYMTCSWPAGFRWHSSHLRSTGSRDPRSPLGSGILAIRTANLRRRGRGGDWPDIPWLCMDHSRSRSPVSPVLGRINVPTPASGCLRRPTGNTSQVVGGQGMTESDGEVTTTLHVP